MKALNITFHGVGSPGRPFDDGEDAVWISSERLYEILDLVKEWPEVRITFDDGNISDLDIACDALTARGLRATFFVVVGRVGQPRFLDKVHLRALISAGMAVGSHGMQHRPWRTLNQSELADEVSGAKDRLEQILGSPVTQVACPFGSYGRTVLRSLRAAGFSRVYTSDGGRAESEAWLQPRNSVHCDEGVNEVTAWRCNRSWSRELTRSAKMLIKTCR